VEEEEEGERGEEEEGESRARVKTVDRSNSVHR